MNSAMIFQIQSTLIVMLLIFGIAKRRQRKLHVKTMVTAIAWDILLILQIELSRGAIAKASKVTSNPQILSIHVALAITTVIFYGFMIWSGRDILKGNNARKELHRKLGMTTFTLRMLTYITSFFAV